MDFEFNFIVTFKVDIWPGFFYDFLSLSTLSVGLDSINRSAYSPIGRMVCLYIRQSVLLVIYFLSLPIYSSIKLVTFFFEETVETQYIIYNQP